MVFTSRLYLHIYCFFKTTKNHVRFIENQRFITNKRIENKNCTCMYY